MFDAHDLWLTPTTSRPAEPWGRYNLGRTDVSFEDLVDKVMAPVGQFTLPHNVMGTPAMSLPLAMHSEGLPIGVQLIAPPAQEHLLLQLGAQLEAGDALEHARAAAACDEIASLVSCASGTMGSKFTERVSSAPARRNAGAA